MPWVPASIATSMIGVASAAVRQRFAASPVAGEHPRRAETAQRRGEQRGRDPEQPAPEQPGAHGEQDPAEHRERHRPVAREQHRHRHAAEQAREAGDHADQTRAADARSRPRAARRPAGCARRGEPRRTTASWAISDAHAERRHERDDRVAPARTPARPRRDRRGRRRSRSASGRPATTPERAGDQRDEQRLAGDQPADLRAASRRGRAARRSPAGAGRWRARTSRRRRTARRRRRCRPARRRWRSARRGPPRSGRRRRHRRRAAVEDVDPAAEALLAGGRAVRPPRSRARRSRRWRSRCPGAPEQRRGDGGREEHRGLALVTRAARVGETADAVPRVARPGVTIAQRGADARAQPARRRRRRAARSARVPRSGGTA